MKATSITGNWTFILSPDKSVQDTTLVKGIRGSEQEEYSSEFDNAYLYEDGNGNITGDLAPFRFEGIQHGDSVILKVYNIKNGHFTPGIATKDMNHISTMRLKIDAFGDMNGHGTYLSNPDYEGAEKESYFVEARKRNPLIASAAHLKKSDASVLETLCDIPSRISSFLISILSDNIFRPIGNCYLEKDGGGYYIFGHTGPGNILPIYTQTVYFPYEWSWCKARRYHFSIELKGPVFLIEALKWYIKYQAPYNLYSNLGFTDNDDLNNAIDDFQKKYGGFAISLGYSLQTKNLSIYINHSKGMDSESKKHRLIKTIQLAMKPFVNNIYIMSGEKITDYWYLRRSKTGICNSPLLFVYLFGTNKVLYN